MTHHTPKPPSSEARKTLPVALAALEQHQQFVLWQPVPLSDGTKPRKVPCNILGHAIDPHDPANWMAAEHAHTMAYAIGFEVGYVLTDNDRFFCIDVDNCIDDKGNWSQLARDIVAAFSGAAVETSVSGTGLHIWGTGTIPPGYKTRNTLLGIEVYHNKRYMALGTGAFGDVRKDCTVTLAQWVPAHLQPSTEAALPSTWTTGPRSEYTGPEDDDVLIDRMINSHSVAGTMGTKATVRQLWEADPVVLGQFFPDSGERAYGASEADSALAKHLVFWTGADCERIERLMRMSGLKRDKWDRKEAVPYLKRTIGNAVALGGDVYDYPVNGAAVTASVPPSEQFGEPVDPFGNFQTPDLPSGVLPKIIEDLTFDEAELIGVDPGGIAIGTIVTCASVIKDEIMVQVKHHDDGWKESARVWGALVGPPSAKKSPAINSAVNPVRRIVKAQRADYQTARNAFDTLDDQDSAMEPAPPSRLMANDTTIEALQSILTNNHDGILVVRDELSGWFGGMEKYSAGKGGAVDKGFWLEAYNGGQYMVDRVARGETYIPNLSVNLIGGIQPDVLAKDIKNMHHDGTLQRFIPIILKPSRIGTDRASNAKIRDGYYQLVRNLYNLTAEPESLLRFDNAAQAVRMAFEVYTHELSAIDELGKHFSAWAGKLDGMFARLCVVFHCVEQSSGPTIKTVHGVIPERIAMMVDRLFREYLIPHGLHFYCSILADGDSLPHARQIAGLILSKGWQRVLRSDLSQNYRPAKNMASRELEQHLDVLVGFGWLYPEHHPTASVKSWIVNPLVHERFKNRAELERTERSEKHRLLLKNITGQN
jgi:hypothetical protein